VSTRERNPTKPTVEGQLLFSIPQAAAVLGIGGRLCWQLVLSGELPSRVLGKRRLVHRRELEKFAARDHASPFKKEKEKWVLKEK
jgi:excisionase family DNA binding protein